MGKNGKLAGAAAAAHEEEESGYVPLEMDDQTVRKIKGKVDKAAGRRGTDAVSRGVIYLGHIPHGFYEPQMRSYFSQFGTVSRLRLSRNRKTRASKHYAFIEFQDQEVAEIVADSMDGYILFERVLQCHVVPPEEVHEDTFVGANQAFEPPNWRAKQQQSHNALRTKTQHKKVVKRLVKKEKARAAKLKMMGVDYELDSTFESQVPRKPKRKTFGDD